MRIHASAVHYLPVYDGGFHPGFYRSVQFAIQCDGFRAEVEVGFACLAALLLGKL